VPPRTYPFHLDPPFVHYTYMRSHTIKLYRIAP
jgi:hypothetical protein